MRVYIDESGDLGWKFDLPYRRGGSSRYLTIASLICPKELSHLPQRIVRKIKKQATNEIKGKDLKLHERELFAKETVILLSNNQDIKIAAITVNKQRVQDHIKADPNKLYNYMISLLILNNIKQFPVVDFIPDPRSVKVASGNSLIDYLQIKLWFDLNVSTQIRHYPQESHRCLNLQYIDIISNIIWSFHENNSSASYNTLKKKVICKTLFF